MKTGLITLLLIFTGFVLLSAQNQGDTIYGWKLKFATLGVPHNSTSGKWIAIKKMYRKKSDTMFVVNTQNPKMEAKKILCAAIPIFINDDAILGLSNNKAEFLNLKNGNNYTYDNVLTAYKLERTKRFVLLTKDKKLQFYNLMGNKTFEVPAIDGQVISDSKNNLYYNAKYNGQWRLMVNDGSMENPIYSTSNMITKIDFTVSTNKVYIIERGLNHEDLLTVFENGQSQKQLLQMAIPAKSEVEFDEIQKGKAYLIKAKIRSKENKNTLVDIWYGSDPFLSEQMGQYEMKKNWIWKINKSLEQINLSDSNIEIQSLNNERYFLAYVPRKNYNYITSAPELNDVTIYDMRTNTFNNLGDFKSMKQTKKAGRDRKLSEEIFCSPDGKRFLASVDGLRWTLFLINGDKENVIDSDDLEYPVFSKNGKEIYFEGYSGLWVYDIEMRKISPLQTGQSKLYKIKNLTTIRNGNIAIPHMQSDNILVDLYDKKSNQSSYKLLQDGKWRNYIETTTNNIKNIVFTPSLPQLITVEENYNQPPALYKYMPDGKRQILFDGNIKDENAKNIRQEILSYSAVGKNLHGVLYYPINFNKAKKYPMVVHIYEIQRNLSNEYLSPNNEFPVGFQIRTLLENGYFVYLPDITYGKKGTGLSALECVDKALDIVLKNTNIDSTKIGLGGHSHGGYETNFVAAHSKRFTAFISGAGNSDIIRSYYSYNYNFGKPFYFQFESEQYQMGTSVAYDTDRYLKNSPILSVQHISAPILLWAGKKDRNIDWDQVMEFYIGLRRYQKDVIALFYQNQGHSFINETPEEKDLSIKLLQWWDYFLKNKTNVSWINKEMKKDAGALPQTIAL